MSRAMTGKDFFELILETSQVEQVDSILKLAKQILTDFEFEELIENLDRNAIHYSEIKKAEEPFLASKDGTPVRIGDKLTDFRGNTAILESYELPKHEGSSGYVNVKQADGFKGHYYVKVYNLHWENLPWGKDMINDSVKDVYPRKDESEKDFIARFMSATKSEYPSKSQRLAVAYSYWNNKK
jgi:hypothetical protein